MKRLAFLLLACPLLTFSTLQASEPEKKASASTADDGYSKLRLGGYGEMVAAFKDYGINRFYGGDNGNRKTHRNTISIPRFVLALDCKFTPKWILGAEIEFESGGQATPSNWKTRRTANMKRNWRRAARWRWSSSTSRASSTRPSTCGRGT